MKKYLLIVFLLLIFLACESKKEVIYTLDELKEKYIKAPSTVELVPIGTYFWDEFGEIKEQYGLTENESKLLGKWINVTFESGPGYNNYAFFPNKLFLLKFYFQNFQAIDAEKMYFNKALGTWEIIDGIVRITIYAIITEDTTRDFPNNKDVFLVEQPYTVDFINIDDINEQGFTKRPINDTILSKELQQMVTIKEHNKTNNLYVRNVYTIDVISNTGPKKNYGYFHFFPEMAQENLSGLDIVMNPELIKKYIPDWMY
jgi:hypothetical protein